MKIGIYGGTFSPPHIGHIGAAKEFIKAVGLDKLFVVPTFRPPHKDDNAIIESDLRLQMCRLAFDMPFCEVSDIEIRRGGKSYTVLTLEEMKKSYPEDELFLLCGTDMVLTLDRWFRAEDIFKLCTIVYVRRENDPATEKDILEKISLFREQFDAEIRHISPRTVELSSSQIRERMARGEDISDLVPNAVADFIRLHGLYARGEYNV